MLNNPVDLSGLSRLPLRLLLLLVCVAALQACRSIPTHTPKTPIVKVDSIKVVKVGFPESELAVRLAVFNPNDYNIPVEKLDFVARYEQEAIAEGSSTGAFDLPAGEQVLTTVSIKSRLGSALAELLLATADKQAEIDLSVEGTVKLANWPVPVPFTEDKTVQNPLLPE